MTIEISPPIAAPKPASTSAKSTSANSATNNKDKANAPEKSQVSAQKGFMDILASLDAAADLALPVTDGGTQKDLMATPDTDADAAALLAQSLQWMSVSGDDKLDGRANSAADMTASANGLTNVFVLPPNGANPAQRSPETWNSGGKSGEGVLDALSGAATHKGGKGHMDTATLQTAFAPDDGKASPASGKADGRDMKLDMKLFQNELSVHTSSASAEPVATTIATLAKREEQKVEHSVFKPSASEGALAPSGSSAWAGGASGYSATGTVDAPQTTEMYVAEQVSYWISNDVQNAEMTLDGIGEKPVEVSININGNEAHVSFRTDEVMARDVLENASQHLKDMLLREGVVLSGVSVGNFGAGDSGAQERNPRQGGRQATVAADRPLIKEVHSGTVKGSVRALDLFV